MNDMQKRAWSNLIAWTLILLMYIILLKSTSDDFDVRIILYVIVFLGLMVFIGVMPILCQKYLPELFHRVRQGIEIFECGFRFWKKVEFDERDRTIKDRANLAGFIATFSLYTVAGLIASSEDSIPGSTLVLVVGAGLGTYIFTRSLALLILYGRGDKGEKS